MAHHVKDAADLEAKLKEAGDHLVVIDFFATWCGPCVTIAPKIEELSSTFPEVIFLKVDVDECDDISENYGIQSMPTFIFIKNSETVDKFSGANYEKLKETIVKYK